MEEKESLHLLVEIRDLQREHLEEYRRVTGEMLEIQRQSVREQLRLGRLYRFAVGVGFLAIAAGVLYIIWSLGGFR